MSGFEPPAFCYFQAPPSSSTPARHQAPAPTVFLSDISKNNSLFKAMQHHYQLSIANRMLSTALTWCGFLPQRDLAAATCKISDPAGGAIHLEINRKILLLFTPRLELKKMESTLKITALFLFLCFGYIKTQAQNCTANAGGNAIICGSTTTLTGGVSGTIGTGDPTWTFVSGPTTPTIVSPNTLITEVTGMVEDGDYVFQLSHPCGTGTATSTVTITAHPRHASFTAGPDITDVCATTGSTPLAGVIPPGFTGEWRSVNIYNFLHFGNQLSTNSQFSSTTSATPTFSLINKVNHEVDPAYYAILRITSLDGNCSYEDTTIVRFIPNPQLVPRNWNLCLSPTGERYIDLELGATAGPNFATDYLEVAGSVASGTTVTLNVISTPPGGTLTYNRIATNRRMYVGGLEVPGNYVYSITVSNDCGTYTTDNYTYTVNGVTPRPVNFQPAGHSAPEQLVLYSAGSSGGELHCSDKVGTTTPERFYFDIHPDDNPATTLVEITNSGIAPPGGFPTIGPVGGAGLQNRWVDITPPTGGWQIGTYRFTVTRSHDGSCPITQWYYIHISDNNRPDVEVPDVSLCYPGTGAISATIPLPEVYKGVVNNSYFQDLGAYYNFSVVSKPAGSGTPVYTASNLRTITHTSTTISNLTMAGDYVFRIVAFSGNGAGPFLEQEYACSGALIDDTFTVRVENPINANAGSDQVQTCVNSLSLSGNDPGAGTGLWTIISSPVGSTPVVTDPSAYNTTVSGVATPGIYELTWAITSPNGGCNSSDHVSFEIISISPDAPTVTIDSPACGESTGTITVTAPLGATYQYSMDGINYQSSPVFNDVTVGSYEISTRIGTAGCVSSTTTVANITVPICGTVFNDANGVTDNTINGTGTNAATTLYAILYDETTGEVTDVVEVNADGTYTLGAIQGNQGSIYITTRPATEGQTTLPVVTLPVGWVNTGEQDCATIPVCTGDDGTPNGLLSLGVVNDPITAANFGIQQPPSADAKEFLVGNSLFSTTPPVGFPSIPDYQSIPLSSPDLTGYTTGGSLSGSDGEDCPDPSECNTGTGTTFSIHSINSNTKVYYDFGSGPVEIDVTGGPVEIENFDVNLIVVYAENGSGSSGNEIGFTYSITDNAGFTSDPVDYVIETSTPLPVRLVGFEVEKEGNTAKLTWFTTEEQNNRGFSIERSHDAMRWEKIGYVETVADNGHSTTVHRYSFTDEAPAKGNNYYRLKQEDTDGHFEYSHIRSVHFVSSSGDVRAFIYPNPVNDGKVVLNVPGSEEILQARVLTLSGTRVLNVSRPKGNILDVKTLSSGQYIIEIVTKSKATITRKLIVE